MTTTEGVRIEIDIPELSDRRNVERKECYLMLYDTYMQYKGVNDYEKLTEDTGIWEPVRANFRWTRFRKDLCDVDMYYDNHEKMWSVCIEWQGVTGPFCFYYVDPKEAVKVYTQLSDYMTGR